MVDYQYSYLLMAIGFFIIWMILFLLRKDTRKEMLIISVFVGLAGPISNILFIQDWWHPISLFDGTKLAVIESILVGFFIGGSISVAYEYLVKKKLKKKKRNELKRNLNIIHLLLIAFVLAFGSFYIFKLNSLISFIISLFIPTLIIWYKRKDLIINSIVSGFLMIIIAIFAYSFIEIITPGWVNAFWLWENTPKIIILNIPIDDFIFYFFAGALLGPLYEYSREAKLINLKKQII